MEMQIATREVWKYELEVGTFTDITMPQGDILSAHIQHGKVYVWCLVIPGSDRRERHFLVALTGQEIKESSRKLKFVDTVMTDDGNFVFHVFEIS